MSQISDPYEKFKREYEEKMLHDFEEKYYELIQSSGVSVQKS